MAVDVGADNIARARQGYAAFAAGDMTTLAEILSPDVEWFVGGENVLTGAYRGRDATFGFFGRLLSITEGTFTVSLRTLAEPEPGLVLALVRLRGQAGTVTYDEAAVQQVEVHNGLVTSCRTYTENSLRFDALVGPRVITLPDTEKAQAGSR